MCITHIAQAECKRRVRPRSLPLSAICTKGEISGAFALLYTLALAIALFVALFADHWKNAAALSLSDRPIPRHLREPRRS